MFYKVSILFLFLALTHLGFCSSYNQDFLELGSYENSYKTNYFEYYKNAEIDHLLRDKCKVINDNCHPTKVYVFGENHNVFSSKIKRSKYIDQIIKKGGKTLVLLEGINLREEKEAATSDMRKSEILNEKLFLDTDQADIKHVELSCWEANLIRSEKTVIFAKWLDLLAKVRSYRSEFELEVIHSKEYWEPKLDQIKELFNEYQSEIKSFIREKRDVRNKSLVNKIAQSNQDPSFDQVIVIVGRNHAMPSKNSYLSKIMELKNVKIFFPHGFDIKTDFDLEYAPKKPNFSLIRQEIVNIINKLASVAI